MNRLLFARLESRLVGALALGLLAFSVVAGVFGYLHAYRHEMAQARSLQQQLVRTVQVQAEVAAFASNTPIAEGVLSGLLANPVIVAARIESAQGFSLSRGRWDAAPLGTQTDYPLLSVVDHLETIGTLTVVQNDEQVQSSAVQSAAFQTALMLLQLLTAVLILATVLRFRLIRPIMRLAQNLGNIRPGSASRLPVEARHRHDEIGMLSHSANTLLQATQEAMAALQHQNGMLSSLLSNLPMGVFMVEVPSGKPLMANDTAKRLLGPDLMSPEFMTEFPQRYPMRRLGGTDPYPLDELPLVLGMRGITAHVDDVQLQRPDGSEVVLEIFGSPVTDEHGKVWASLVSFSDITERKRIEDQVHQLAFYDPLTGLPNRRLLTDRMNQAMAVSQRRNTHCALMFLDLDNFKPLNDVHGHGVGDSLLVEVARRLGSCRRQMDTVVRLGGDEFVVLLSELDSDPALALEQARAVAEKIRASLSDVYALAVVQSDRTLTVEHRCSASIGVVVFLGNQTGATEILKRADAAMYRAKERGRDAIHFHEDAGA